MSLKNLVENHREDPQWMKMHVGGDDLVFGKVQEHLREGMHGWDLVERWLVSRGENPRPVPMTVTESLYRWRKIPEDFGPLTAENNGSTDHSRRLFALPRNRDDETMPRELLAEVLADMAVWDQYEASVKFDYLFDIVRDFLEERIPKSGPVPHKFIRYNGDAHTALATLLYQLDGHHPVDGIYAVILAHLNRVLPTPLKPPRLIRPVSDAPPLTPEGARLRFRPSTQLVAAGTAVAATAAVVALIAHRRKPKPRRTR